MPAQGALRDGLGAGERLIETLRFDPDLGFVRLDGHLARLEGSAEALGFAFRPSAVREALAGIAARGALCRVRLTMGREGDIEATTARFTPLAESAIWRLAIASSRLNSSDVLLRHKTTRRAVYERARSEFAPADADEVLLLNERGEVCEGTITSLFVASDGDGPLLTPDLGCGLLAGVLRAELLASGRAREVRLTPDQLSGAAGVFVGNSLRGLIRARLIAA